MISRKKWFIAAAGAVAALAFGAPGALAGTVVAVTGPSASDYPVGTQIGDTQRISLSNGDRLTVLDNGGTRVFSGPGTYILARQGRQSSNSALNALTRQRQASRARTGAVRGTGAPATRPNLWYVDVATEGKVCLSDPTSVRLWRADTTFERPYVISAVADPDAKVELTFNEGEMLAGWDSRIALTEGLIYTIAAQPAGAGADAPAEPINVDFVFLDEVPDDAEGLAGKLIEHGCMGQVEVLATSEDLRS